MIQYLMENFKEYKKLDKMKEKKKKVKEKEIIKECK